MAREYETTVTVGDDRLLRLQLPPWFPSGPVAVTFEWDDTSTSVTVCPVVEPDGPHEPLRPEDAGRGSVRNEDARS